MFCVVSTNSLTMAAAGAIRRRHLPNGGIQWLPVKPWTCSIGRCAPRPASPRQSELPAICLQLCRRQFYCRPQQKLNNIVIIILNLNWGVELFINMLVVYLYCLGAHCQRWMPLWPPFLAVDERFIDLYKTLPKSPWPTPADGLLHIMRLNARKFTELSR